MSYSRSELRTEIAENLGIKQQGQALVAADVDKIDKSIEAAIGYLQTENVVIFDASGTDSAEDIPDELFLPLAEYVESFVAPSFGKPRDPGLREDALRRIRRVALKGKADKPTRANYY